MAVLALVLFAAGCGGEQDERERQAGTAPSALGPPVEEVDATLAVGFERTDFTRHSVPFSEFQSGGPPRDGIPSIDRPRFLSVAGTRFLAGREPVVALEVDRDARAYPLQILTWHEIVNDVVGDTPVAITFCPLCNTALAFDRRVDGKTLSFGTTGKLRNSDLVMYDRETESWWQQFGGEGIVGLYTGRALDRIPARIVSWEQFRREHPDGRVLSRETGFDRPYGRNPYEGYDDVASPPFFGAENLDDDRLAPKERVVFVERGGEAVAVPFAALAKKRSIAFELEGHRLVVRWRGGVASALD